MASDWQGSISTNHAIAGNWVPSGVPATGDDATFTATSQGNCILTANLALASLDMQAAMPDNIDLATFNLTMDPGGNVILDSTTGRFDMGTGTLSITNGTFDYADVGTIAGLSSTLVFSGTCNWIAKNGFGSGINDVTIASGTTTIPVTAAINVWMQGALHIDGELLIASGEDLFNQGTLTTAAGAHIGGDGIFILVAVPAGKGFTSRGAGTTIDCGEFWIRPGTTSPDLAAGEYDVGLFKFYNPSTGAALLSLDGSFVFTGDVEFENVNAGGSLTIDNSVNDPDIELQGDLVRDEQAGTITYVAGGGDFSLTGMANQIVDFGGSTIEALTIDKPLGAVTLNGDFTTPTFSGVDVDTFDPNEKTIHVLGDCDFAAAFTIGAFPYFGGSTWTIDGKFTCHGQTFLADIPWQLNLSEPGIASGVGSIQNCDASGGSPLVALKWTNLGGCTNVIFGGPPLLEGGMFAGGFQTLGGGL